MLLRPGFDDFITQRLSLLRVLRTNGGLHRALPIGITLTGQYEQYIALLDLLPLLPLLPPSSNRD